MVVLRVVAFAAGTAVVALTFSSAIRTVVVPRAASALLPRLVFGFVGAAFGWLAARRSGWAGRDRILAYHAPVALVLLAMTWILLVAIGFAPIYWAVGADGWRDAARISGSSVTTLGFGTTGNDWPGTLLEVTEAVIGLILIALLISFLPTMYSLFSSRERMVAYMAVRAGTPPSAVDLLDRMYRIGDDGELHDIWSRFEAWFDELAETHTSFDALAYFRSPNPDRSWLTTSGAVLDAAALHQAAVAAPPDPRASLCIRAGYSALRDVAGAHRIDVPLDPAPGDPISIQRDEFDTALTRLADAGVPLVDDRDRAWQEFSGWRVNYDAPLLSLCALVSAPYAPWSSDRSVATRRPTIRSLILGRHHPL